MGVSIIMLYCLRGAAEKWDWFQCIDTVDVAAGSSPFN
jgi:hypothetical protein